MYLPSLDLESTFNIPSSKHDHSSTWIVSMPVRSCFGSGPVRMSHLWQHLWVFGMESPRCNLSSLFSHLAFIHPPFIQFLHLHRFTCAVDVGNSSDIRQASITIVILVKNGTNLMELWNIVTRRDNWRLRLRLQRHMRVAFAQQDAEVCNFLLTIVISFESLSIRIQLNIMIATTVLTLQRRTLLHRTRRPYRHLQDLDVVYGFQDVFRTIHLECGQWPWHTSPQRRIGTLDKQS